MQGLVQLSPPLIIRLPSSSIPGTLKYTFSVSVCGSWERREKNRLERGAPPRLTLSAWIVVSAAPSRVRNSSFSSSSSSSATARGRKVGREGGEADTGGTGRWGGLRDTSCLHSSYRVGNKRHTLRNIGVDVQISCRIQSSNITDGVCTGRGAADCRHTCIRVNGIIPQGP